MADLTLHQLQQSSIAQKLYSAYAGEALETFIPQGPFMLCTIFFSERCLMSAKLKAKLVSKVLKLAKAHSEQGNCTI